MKQRSFILLFSSLLLLCYSCRQPQEQADAYGNFEAVEIMVASQAAGPLLQFNVNEGDILKAGQTIGLVDTVPLTLKLDQLLAQREAIASRNTPIARQVDVLKQQKQNLLTDQTRISNLVKSGSATTKQLDDINAQMALLDKQIESAYAQGSSIGAELKSADAQIAQVKDQLQRCHLINPVDGTVLTKYAEESEVVAAGRNLYQLADLTQMNLRAYVSGEQLSSIKIGQPVKVRFDAEGGTFKETNGTITWIASSAEFTPKIVQTKDERTSLVYAIKIAVDNKDGQIKIGMPGEMLISK